MTKNSADAIQARVDNMYTDESVGRVYVDVMFLLLENKRLREALGWYADKDNYIVSVAGIVASLSNAGYDKGERARKALEGDES